MGKSGTHFDDGLVNEVRQEHIKNEPPVYSTRFQILATSMVLLSALSGAMLGAIFSESKTNKDLVSWVALPGDLFIRALKCIVLPLVFVNVILAMIQMAEAGKAAAVGMYTIIIYLCTTTFAALEGLIMVQIFQSQFSAKIIEPDPTFIRFLCPQKDFILVQQGSDVLCRNISEVGSNSLEANFEVTDLHEFFERQIEFEEPLTFSQTLQENIFKQLVAENIFEEFANFSFIGVIMFSVIVGAAASKLKQRPVLIVEFLEDINDIFVRMIEWIILTTPFAVFSLISGALAPQDDLGATMKDIGVLLAATLCSDVIHLGIVLPGLFYFFTKTNPFAYMRYLVPAQSFAFSCASSAATLPVTMRCVKASGQVPDSIRDFVLPIGATINMDGIAIYFPPALVYLANAAQVETGPAEYLLIIIVATIGSAGTAPVPNGGILLLLTAYNTVYGGQVPEAFGILFGVQWLVDRFQVIINITGDAMVARMITSLADAEIKPERPTSIMEIDDTRSV